MPILITNIGIHVLSVSKLVWFEFWKDYKYFHNPNIEKYIHISTTIFLFQSVSQTDVFLPRYFPTSHIFSKSFFTIKTFPYHEGILAKHFTTAITATTFHFILDYHVCPNLKHFLLAYLPLFSPSSFLGCCTASLKLIHYLAFLDIFYCFSHKPEFSHRITDISDLIFCEN